MRNLVWTISVSVDGYMEGSNGEIDWHTVSEEFFRHQVEWLGRAGAFLEGRATYELMAEFWPTADEDPGATPMTVEFARIWREMPKLVYSRTLDHADWNATVLHDVVPADVLSLKAQDGGDLVLGGSKLATEFARHDLIDEYRIYVHPVLIGRGTPMLQPTEAKYPLALSETHTFGNGVVLLRYQRRPHGTPGNGPEN